MTTPEQTPESNPHAPSVGIVSSDLLGVLRAAIPYVTIEADGFLRWDTGDTEPKEQWLPLCELQEELREHGCYLHESGTDHDTIWGYVRLSPNT